MRPLEDIEADYIQYLRMERNLSTHTVRAYSGDLESFFNHLEMQKVGQISDLTIAHIRSWLANQQVKGGARTTLSRRTVAIRLFTKWATKHGYLTKDVGATLATPKGHRTLPEVLSVSDASTAMDSLATRVEAAQMFRAAAKKVGLKPGEGLHQLRHTCVSVLIASGANFKQIQAWVGHASISETLDTYGHLFPESMMDLADKLDYYVAIESGKENRKTA